MDIINAFQNNVKASLDTILQIDSQKLLAESSPQDFILDYCLTPLESLGIQVLEVEIQKEVQMQFFSLAEQQKEFVPITTMRDIRDTGRFQIKLHAKSLTVEFRASFVFTIHNSRNLEVEHIRIESVKLLKNSLKGSVSMAKRFGAFFKPVAQSSLASIMVETIKRMLLG